MPHSPSPWRFVPRKDGSGHIVTRAENPILYLAATTAEGATDYAFNAMLIEAAPDLLAACKALYALQMGNATASQTIAAGKMAEAAIAKAERRARIRPA